MICSIILALAIIFGVSRTLAGNDLSHSMTTLADSSCKDNLDTCYLLDPSYYCIGDFEEWAAQNCQKTCNLCGYQTYKPSPTLPTTPHSTPLPVHTGGYCYYANNGVYYDQGDTWEDGCSRICTCTDASVGLYSCRATCLNWNKLPNVCKLEDAPSGMCCKQPRCPSNIIVTIPKGFKEQYPGYGEPFVPIG